MRHELEKILGEELRILAIQTKDRLHLTQKEMGRRLHMSESSYSDIETGHTTCGALTEALLLEMKGELEALLHMVIEKFPMWYEREMQAV